MLLTAPSIAPALSSPSRPRARPGLLDRGHLRTRRANRQGPEPHRGLQAGWRAARRGQTTGSACTYPGPSVSGARVVAGFCVGAKERATELPSGIINMGARVYDPYTGTFLQTDPIPGADANAYGYTDGDPINEVDLTGQDAAAVGAAEGAGALCSETLFGAFVCAVVAYGGTTALEAIAGSSSSSSSSNGPPPPPPHTGANGNTGTTGGNVSYAKQQPKAKTQEETTAQQQRDANQSFDPAAANRGDKKDVFNEKAAGTRNKQKRNSN